ncbi:MULTISPECIES: YkvA family protein [unclassified Siphonobacter]|uniref:YkvA family protein n=1 Tax=unclassified Siphonobacter TaxID=2635712 RepID=UPI000CAB757D|nr:MULTISPECIES: DUF1232 domain-containing protein [unclassified Siphonobacter]MDQ1087500.1 uncharacterized membrane protein YkvA (DUF1232 family) [Siphonobacter sp. SORGH_AS_1065]MDR6193643.1 uncharacterized membrane protein YkvA (DUF1232 family) [Siphonobacter sp. SORGH_AS_0500]PKK36493.1 hypothetical protein BWI96_11600 [Siphonobacter sp. SORGH_AS_0500]
MADTKNLLERILHSVFFKSAQKKASKSARNPAFLLQLMTRVFQASNKAGIISDVQEKISLLGRLIRAYAKGEYRTLPWKSLVLTVTVLIYFVSPIDVIPDLLPIVGFTDDVALLVWLFRTISTDLDAFSEWEKRGAVTVEEVK